MQQKGDVENQTIKTKKRCKFKNNKETLTYRYLSFAIFQIAFFTTVFIGFL